MTRATEDTTMKRANSMPNTLARAGCLSRAAVACAVVLAISACATIRATPQAPQKPSVPEAWSQGTTGVTTANEDLARWWERLGNPTLSHLVEQALQSSPDIRTARSSLRKARAQRDLALANRRPSLSGSGSGSSGTGTDSDAKASASVGIDASWEIDVFGGLKHAVTAAEADLAATAEDFHNTQVSLVAEVATNYLDLRSAQAQLEILRNNLAKQMETLQLTEWRAQAGLVGSLDVEQSRTTVEQTKSQIPTLETSIAEAEHRLAILIGLEPTALKAQLDKAGDVPAVPDAIGIGIPANMLRQRPDLRAAERRVLAETARLARTRTTRYPSFNLSGSLTTTAVTGALTGGTSVLASIVGSVAQTLFDGGRITQQIEIQSATQEQAVISYESTVLTALEEVENALVSLEKTREQLASLQAAAIAARNAALLARNEYTAGLVDFQTVLDTERTVLTVENSVATTQASRTSALIQLYKALGGGWSPTQQATTTSSQVGRS